MSPQMPVQSTGTQVLPPLLPLGLLGVFVPLAPLLPLLPMANAVGAEMADPPSRQRAMAVELRWLRRFMMDLVGCVKIKQGGE